MLEYSTCLVHTPLPHSSKSLIHMRLTVGAFWKNSSFSEHVLREITGAFVDTEPRGIEATSIIVVTGDKSLGGG